MQRVGHQEYVYCCGIFPFIPSHIIKGVWLKQSSGSHSVCIPVLSKAPSTGLFKQLQFS